MLTELFTSARVTAIGFWAIAALNLPQVALILYFSIADADKFNSCDRPVSLWLIFHGVRLLLSVVVAGLPLYNARRFHPYTMRYRRLTDTMNMLGLFVFVWGNFTGQTEHRQTLGRARAGRQYSLATRQRAD